MVLWSSWQHHTHIVIQSYTYNIQSYTYNHAMVLHAGKMNQGPGKCSGCLLRCWCVHSIPFLQVTELLIDLGQATNMNWYRRNHVGWHAVTNCIWSYDRHHDIMRTLSYNHTSIIHIQSYRYKHTHTTMQWCRTQVRDAFPWVVVQTHEVQVFTLNTLCSQFAPAVDKIVYESAASNQHELIHTQSLWITRSY